MTRRALAACGQYMVDVNLIFRIAGIGIIVAILNQVLKNSGRDDMAMMTTLAGVIVVLMMLIPVINSLFESVESVFSLYAVRLPRLWERWAQ
jgi:stage III sporulation protein AC